MSAEDIIDGYLSGALTSELAGEHGVTERSIRRLLGEHGVPLRTAAGAQPKYTVNASFFKTWTPEMAYVLGFILTDGCIVRNSLTIAQKERSILSRIAAAMGSNHPIKLRANGPSNTIYTLQISRKEIVDDLRALGVTEKKSLSVAYPDVPGDYMSHFIRGVVDGDGWIHSKGYVMNVTSGSSDFASGLCSVLSKRDFNVRITQDAAYRVWVSGKEDVRRLGHWIYDGCGALFLPRKRERFEFHLVA